ncbi:MAG: nicotinamide-nucleotide amidohydrolase family protein, partial [Flavisolibacter sp.]|nr:nicotinamide-nucleotide amidohydrolase family protein [Flavisolibacter sp.]
MQDIILAIDEEIKTADVIIITGGLGPTADDITKPALCSYFDSRIVTDEAVKAHIINIFKKNDRLPGITNLQQADVPHNCLVLENKRGTAPGMWFEKNGVVLISLPGVPNEMQGIMDKVVIPKLKSSDGLPCILHKTLLTAGVGESVVAEKIAAFENALPENIKLAYLPAYGQVRLRLTGRADDLLSIHHSIEDHFNKLKSLVSEWIVADEDISLTKALHKLLDQNQKTVATAESCTGGYIAHLITQNAGASKIFKGSVVAYSNDIKTRLLGVQQATLEVHGAVSEATVREMASGLLKNMNCDYAIATSGIMGPEGGSVEKPVGTVWMAVAGRNKV